MDPQQALSPRSEGLRRQRRADTRFEAEDSGQSLRRRSRSRSRLSNAASARASATYSAYLDDAETVAAGAARFEEPPLPLRSPGLAPQGGALGLHHTYEHAPRTFSAIPPSPTIIVPPGEYHPMADNRNGMGGVSVLHAPRHDFGQVGPADSHTASSSSYHHEPPTRRVRASGGASTCWPPPAQAGAISPASSYDTLSPSIASSRRSIHQALTSGCSVRSSASSFDVRASAYMGTDHEGAGPSSRGSSGSAPRRSRQSGAYIEGEHQVQAVRDAASSGYNPDASARNWSGASHQDPAGGQQSWRGQATTPRMMGANDSADGAGGDGFGGGGGGLPSGLALRRDGSEGGGSFSNGSGGSWGGEGGGGGGGAADRGDAGAGGGGDDEAEARDKAAKKANPLIDLIETETAYVAELSTIIRKVAGAWSRTNFPPPELDIMFRNVESIYRVNRSFLKSLKEIGPNPSSPRALGDLLMRWIDDLEAPYSRYCDNFFTDFDTWPVIQSNARLPVLLAEISEPTQADGSPVVYSDKKRRPGEVWSLDQLFSLPQIRLKYYKKLYARLLKSTQAGRSDHRLLVSANEKLDELLERAKNRISMSVLDEGPQVGGATRGSEESSAADTTSLTNDSTPLNRASSATSASMEGGSSGSGPPPLPKEHSLSPPMLASRPGAGGGGVPMHQPSPMRQGTADTIVVANQHQQPSDEEVAAAESLEVRLNTARTLDLFTMKPKKCVLRINTPSLPYRRTLRRAADVVIHFTPLSTGQEVVFRRAHIFLLTDLFLVCERMTPSEKIQQSSNQSEADMWLLFPPLAGKHVRVSEGERDNVFNVTVLKKEVLQVHTSSAHAKHEWMMHFEDCNRFASNMGLKLQTAAGGAATSTPQPGDPQYAMSPAISVTPSSQGRDPDGMFSPHSSTGASLMREGSFNSVASFPKSSFGPAGGQSDLRLPGAPGSGSSASSRSPSPSPSSPAPPMPPHFAGGAPPRPMAPGDFRPGMVRPPQMAPNGAMSPPNGAHAYMGRPPPPRPGEMPPFRPGMHGRPPFPPGGGGPNGAAPPPGGWGMPPRPPGQPVAMNGRPPGRPFGPGQGLYPAQDPGREPQRRPSAPNLRMEQGGPANTPLRSRSTSSVGSRGDGVGGGVPQLPSEMLKNPSSRPKESFSPPSSPKMKRKGPVTSTVSAQMRCRVYLKQNHAQWKSLGNARLKLYHLMPDDEKQLVVENDRKTLISTLVLTDGVERVGKVGVAVELSDQGARTGIVYMLQMRSEESANGLFGQLLEGSDRTTAAGTR